MNPADATAADRPAANAHSLDAGASSPAGPVSVATLYRHLWRHAEGARWTLLFAGALLIGSQLVKLLLPWMAAQAIDALQRGGASAVGEAAGWVAALLGIYVTSWSMHGPGRVFERNVAVRVRTGIATALYAKLMRAPLAWHDRHHSGDVQQRVNQATHALYNFAQNQFLYLQSAVNFVGPVLALALLSPATGGLAMGGYVVVAAVVLRFDAGLMQLSRRENDADRRYAAGLLDFIGNAGTVIGLRLQGATAQLLGQRLQAVFAPLRRSIVINEMKWCAVDLLSWGLTWGLVAGYVWQTRAADVAAGAGAGAGSGSAAAPLLIGSLFMIYQYAQQAGGVIGGMADNFQSFARTRTDFASAELVWQAPQTPPSLASVPAGWQRIDVCDLGFDHAAALPAHTSPGQAPLRAERGGLQAVTLTLRRGQRIALVGPSGSGKSTLMRVLAGLYLPQHGHFEVDGVVRLGLHHLGSVGTLIPQEADVFQASLRENLAFGVPADEPALQQALHVSAFDDVLPHLEQGLETPISERGMNLSGGQRQRLCLARGVLAARGSSLLMLDEPTSALDPVTEALVHQRLGEAFADACIVASVHRLSLLEHFDTVVLMAGGRVLDSGTPAELAQRQPLFRELLRQPEAEPPAEAAPAAA